MQLPSFVRTTGANGQKEDAASFFCPRSISCDELFNSIGLSGPGLH